MKNTYENASMLDMIFEHRNKAYGAYALRKSYNKTIAEALVITFSVVVFIGMGKFLSDKLKTPPKALKEIFVIAEPIPEIEFEDEIVQPETPPPPPHPEGSPTQENTEFAVTQNAPEIDSIPPTALMNDIDPGLTTNLTGSATGIPDGTSTEPAPPTAYVPPVNNTIYTEPVEVMPEYPGGEKKLLEFLRKNTNYPDYERELEIEGKAYAKFVVNTDGSISSAEVVRTDSRGFGKEAVRVVSLLENFKPGMQQGRPVRVQLVLPFSFRLNH